VAAQSDPCLEDLGTYLHEVMRICVFMHLAHAPQRAPESCHSYFVPNPRLRMLGVPYSAEPAGDMHLLRAGKKSAALGRQARGGGCQRQRPAFERGLALGRLGARRSEHGRGAAGRRGGVEGAQGGGAAAGGPGPPCGRLRLRQGRIVRLLGRPPQILAPGIEVRCDGMKLCARCALHELNPAPWLAAPLGELAMRHSAADKTSSGYEPACACVRGCARAAANTSSSDPTGA